MSKNDNLNDRKITLTYILQQNQQHSFNKAYCFVFSSTIKPQHQGESKESSSKNLLCSFLTPFYSKTDPSFCLNVLGQQNCVININIIKERCFWRMVWLYALDHWITPRYITTPPVESGRCIKMHVVLYLVQASTSLGKSHEEMLYHVWSLNLILNF